MRIEQDVKLDYNDVLIRPKRSTLVSRNSVSAERSITRFKHSTSSWTGLPLIAANMDTVGTFEMATALSKHGAMTALHKFYTAQQLADFYINNANLRSSIFFTFGVSSADQQKMQQFKKLIPNETLKDVMICLDVANGYFEKFANRHLPDTRNLFPESVIMAGNVVTGEMTEQLILAGADIVKIGIGPGSACRTREVTGVGYPQLSAVMECADAAHGMGGWVCADGGCVVSGDVCKALGAGADFVMLGGMLAGHDECQGKIVTSDSGVSKMMFYGMSSETAMETHYGGKPSYRASEGRTVLIDHRGPVSATIEEIVGGIRSMMTYIGALKLKDVPKATTFIRVNSQYNNVFANKEI